MTARAKISELTAAAPLDGGEELPVVQGGATRRTSARSLWRVPVLVEAGASRVLALADMGTLIRCTATAGCAVELPSDATLAVPVGSVVGFVHEGTDQVILSAGAEATLRVPATYLPRTLETSALMFAFKTAADTWTVTGTLAPA